MLRSHFISYSIGIVSVIIAFLFSLIARTLAEPNYYLFFLAAVAFSVWLRGLRAGLVATGLAVLLSSYFLHTPENSWLIDSQNVMHTIIFVVVALLINWFTASRINALKALNHSQSELENFINSAAVAMNWTDANGRIVWANTAELDLLGYTRQEYIGHKMADFYVDARVFEDMLRQLMARETLHNYEAQLRCKDGTVKEVLINANALWEHDKFIHTRSFVRDITERKRMEQKIQDREEQVETSPDAITLTDMQGTIIFCNQQAAQLYGCENADDMIGCNALEGIAPEEQQRALANMQKTMETGCVRNVNYSLIRKNGTRFPAELSASLIRDGSGNPKAFIGVVRDISERQAADEALRRYAEELESRNRELDAYGHTIAHDLKSPLSLMIGYANLVLDMENSLSEESKEYIDRIQVNGQRLVKMIEQLLELARLRNATETIIGVNVNAAVDSALIRYKDQLDSRHIEVEIPPDLPYALAHAPWIEEIFANLIGNAIKYMGADNPEPKIIIRGYRQGPTIRYEVQDNGIGIDPKDHARLFDMFSRLHVVDTPGFGLGLSIVHRLVGKLGGQLGVESLPGQGSTFWFTLHTLTEAQPLATPEPGTVR
jgi:PAS domain S-box-containing protein